MRVIRSEVVIDSSRSRVWLELTSFAQYGEWNPFLPEVEAAALVGSPMRALSRLPIGLRLRFTGEIISVVSEETLAWRAHARTMPTAAFDVIHTLELSEVQDGTRLVQREEVSGFVVPLSGWILRQAERGQAQMNQALRERLER